MKPIILVILSLFLVNCSQYSEPQGLSNRPAERVTTTQIEEPLEATFSSIKLNIINPKCISCHNPQSADKKAKDIPLTRESEVLDGDLVIPGNAVKSKFYRAMIQDEAIRGRIKIMPPADSGKHAVTEEQIQVVAAWINGVAKKEPAKASDTDPNCQPPPGNGPGGVPVTQPPQVAPGNQPPVVAPVIVAPTEPVIAEPDLIDFAFIKTQILENKCNSCHKVGGKADELIFSDLQSLLDLKNSFGQDIIVPGKPEQSLMYLSLIKDEAIRQDTRLMPPEKDVKAGKVKDITEQETNWVKKWIAEGAK